MKWREISASLKAQWQVCRWICLCWIWSVERAWMEARDEGNGQKESHLPPESSSDQSNPVSAIIHPQSTLPPNSDVLYNSQSQGSSCKVGTGMLNGCHKWKIIILSMYHLSECEEVKESQLYSLSLVCLGFCPSFISLCYCNRRRHREWMEIKNNEERNCQQLYHNSVQPQWHAIKVEVGFFISWTMLLLNW